MSRGIERDILPTCRELGMRFPRFSDANARENARLVNALRQIARERGRPGGLVPGAGGAGDEAVEEHVDGEVEPILATAGGHERAERDQVGEPSRVQ